MVELLRDTQFRLLFILLPAIFAIIVRKQILLDRYVLALILVTVSSEVFTLFHHGYNLVHYSIFTILDVIIISALIAKETEIKSIIPVNTVVTIIIFLFFIITDFSSINWLPITNTFPHRSPLDSQQFFDFCALASLILIITIFIWLFHVVSTNKNLQGGLTKRFIFITGMLAFYCGGFFTVAFGRYIVGDISIWFEYWNKIYLPLYLLFYLTLNIGLLWKPTPSLSS